MMDSDDILIAQNAAVASLSFAELLAHINAGGELRNVLRPNNLRVFVLEVCIRLVNHAPVVLLDADLSPNELNGVVNEPALSTRNALSSVANVDELLLAIASSASTISIFTSGTTGAPKRVDHSVQSLTRTVRTGPKYKGNKWGFAYSYTHMAGIQVFFQALLNGNTIVDLFGKQKSDIINEMVRNQITHISATPTFFRLLLPLAQPLLSVQKLSVGGEKSSDALVTALHAAFPSAKINNIYASTEAGTLLHAHGAKFCIPDSLSDRICIKDSELLVHSSLLGSSADIELNDDWFATGDLIEFVDDKQIFFRFLSRKTDIINVGGNKVSPLEVEDVLMTLPAIAQAKVYARFSSVLGNILVADVVCDNPTITEKWVRDALASLLQDYKVPRKINFVTQMTLTRTGKLQR
jgi:acyl-coenzyme A synthetase/AMP-(fatty) acid ligase